MTVTAYSSTWQLTTTASANVYKLTWVGEPGNHPTSIAHGDHPQAITMLTRNGTCLVHRSLAHYVKRNLDLTDG